MTLYPINSLRNYARLLADSPLIANIDVDMLGSVGLSASLLLGWDVAKNRPQPGTSPVPGQFECCGSASSHNFSKHLLFKAFT